MHLREQDRLGREAEHVHLLHGLELRADDLFAACSACSSHHATAATHNVQLATRGMPKGTRYPQYCGYSRGFLVDRSLRGVPFVSLCRTAAMLERCPTRRSNKDIDNASTGTDDPSVSWLEDGASTLLRAPKISMETKSHGRPARLMPCACRMLPDSWCMAHESATVRPLTSMLPSCATLKKLTHVAPSERRR